MVLTLGIESRLHWWEESALTLGCFPIGERMFYEWHMRGVTSELGLVSMLQAKKFLLPSYGSYPDLIQTWLQLFKGRITLSCG